MALSTFAELFQRGSSSQILPCAKMVLCPYSVIKCPLRDEVVLSSHSQRDQAY